MCGITGFYSTAKLNEKKRFQEIGRAMCRAISHRGPDGQDLWQGEDTPLILGHLRLAIIDLSDEGKQPMTSASGRYVMTYNGEFYNFQDMRKDLKSAGVSFRGRSDTEVFLAAIDYWGLNLALQKISGMFAIALWDRHEKVLHFMRDRMGKKPLYIGWAGQSLVFGSELKALRVHPDFKAEINRNSLNAYIQYGYVPAPHCIYQNVWTLPAGHRMALHLPSLEAGQDLQSKMEAYWNHLRVLQESRTKENSKSDAALVEEFETLLKTCVRDRMVSDVPLGAFLSGGIDSSTIVALMQKESARPVKTYSIGFDEAGFDEAVYAKKVAAHLGTDHRELYLKPEDTRDVIPLLPDIYDEPFSDISAIPTYLVSKFAREDVTVALSGDGGDEMLGGYNRHLIAPKLASAMTFLPRPLREAMARGILSVPPEKWAQIKPNRPEFGTHIHKVAQMLPMRSRKEIYRALLSGHPNAGDLVLGSETPAVLDDGAEWDPDGQGLSFAEEMMARDAMGYLPNDILAKVDRASMAVALEARAPLLDMRIYSYVWGLPENAKIRGGQGKWLLRETLKRHVPAALFERPKQGFSMPVSAWLRGPLKEWGEELLSPEKLKNQGYLNPALVRCLWNSHQSGQRDIGPALWTILMFQAWLERWV